jgi:ABC-type amino acid transport system permease subunit
MTTLLTIVAMLTAVALGYVVALDSREPFDRLSGTARFGVFLVVAGGGGLLFRDIVSMASPFVEGYPTGDALVNFLAALVLLAVVIWVYFLTKPDTAVLSAGISRLTAGIRRPSAFASSTAAPSAAAPTKTCPSCGHPVAASAAVCESCGASVQPATSITQPR